MTEADVLIVAALLQQGDIDYSNEELPADYSIEVGDEQLPEWLMSGSAWLAIIHNELLPAAKERGLSLREIMGRYVNGGPEYGWPEQSPWNVDFTQEDPRRIMYNALRYVDEKKFPASAFARQ